MSGWIGPQIEVWRGITWRMSDRAVAADPVASAARRTVADFDRYLEVHDAPAPARLEDGFTVFLAGRDNAFGGAYSITLGGSGQLFTRHSSTSSEIVGHELAHTVAANLDLQVEAGVEEGWADVIGNGFARWRGEPGTADWTLASGMVRPGLAREFPETVGDGYLRDLKHPVVAGVDELHAYARRLDGRSRLPPFDTHAAGGVVSRAAALAADAVGPGRAHGIFLEAFLNDLPPRIHAANGAVARAAARPDAPRGTVAAAIRSHDAAFRASARATMDAAARLHGSKSHPFAAVEDAWRAVGVRDVRWSPRLDG